MKHLTAIKYLTMLVAVVACLSGIAAATASANLINDHPLAGDSAQNLVDPDVCQGIPGPSDRTDRQGRPSPLCGGTPCSVSGDQWQSYTQPFGCSTPTAMAAFNGYDPRWTQDCPSQRGAMYRTDTYDGTTWQHLWSYPFRCSDGSWFYSRQEAYNRNLVAYMTIWPGQGTSTHWQMVLYPR